MSISTHILDTSLGKPAAGVPVQLEHAGVVLARGTTDSDGRIRDLGPRVGLPAGDYRLVFEVREYLAGKGADPLYPEVVVSFTIRDGAEPYHLPLLLSPFGYSTYRGS